MQFAYEDLWPPSLIWPEGTICHFPVDEACRGADCNHVTLTAWVQRLWAQCEVKMKEWRRVLWGVKRVLLWKWHRRGQTQWLLTTSLSSPTIRAFGLCSVFCSLHAPCYPSVCPFCSCFPPLSVFISPRHIAVFFSSSHPLFIVSL